MTAPAAQITAAGALIVEKVCSTFSTAFIFELPFLKEFLLEKADVQKYRNQLLYAIVPLATYTPPRAITVGRGLGPRTPRVGFD